MWRFLTCFVWLCRFIKINQWSCDIMISYCIQSWWKNLYTSDNEISDVFNLQEFTDIFITWNTDSNKYPVKIIKNYIFFLLISMNISVDEIRQNIKYPFFKETLCKIHIFFVYYKF